MCCSCSHHLLSRVCVFLVSCRPVVSLSFLSLGFFSFGGRRTTRPTGADQGKDKQQKQTNEKSKGYHIGMHILFVVACAVLMLFDCEKSSETGGVCTVPSSGRLQLEPRQSQRETRRGEQRYGETHNTQERMTGATVGGVVSMGRSVSRVSSLLQ